MSSPVIYISIYPSIYPSIDSTDETFFRAEWPDKDKKYPNKVDWMDMHLWVNPTYIYLYPSIYLGHVYIYMYIYICI